MVIFIKNTRICRAPNRKNKKTKNGRNIKTFQQVKLKQKTGKSSENVLQAELNVNSFSDSPIPNTKTNDVAYMVINWNDLSTAYTDITG